MHRRLCPDDREIELKSPLIRNDAYFSFSANIREVFWVSDQALKDVDSITSLELR
jgi:hypothetical protein